MRKSRHQLDDMVHGSGSPYSHFQVTRAWQRVCTQDLIYWKMPDHIFIFLFFSFLGVRWRVLQSRKPCNIISCDNCDQYCKSGYRPYGRCVGVYGFRTCTCYFKCSPWWRSLACIWSSSFLSKTLCMFVSVSKLCMFVCVRV